MAPARPLPSTLPLHGARCPPPLQGRPLPFYICNHGSFHLETCPLGVIQHGVRLFTAVRYYGGAIATKYGAKSALQVSVAAKIGHIGGYPPLPTPLTPLAGCFAPSVGSPIDPYLLGSLHLVPRVRTGLLHVISSLRSCAALRSAHHLVPQSHAAAARSHSTFIALARSLRSLLATPTRPANLGSPAVTSKFCQTFSRYLMGARVRIIIGCLGVSFVFVVGALYLCNSRNTRGCWQC